MLKFFSPTFVIGEDYMWKWVLAFEEAGKGYQASGVTCTRPSLLLHLVRTSKTGWKQRCHFLNPVLTQGCET